MNCSTEYTYFANSIRIINLTIFFWLTPVALLHPHITPHTFNVHVLSYQSRLVQLRRQYQNVFYIYLLISKRTLVGGDFMDSNKCRSNVTINTIAEPDIVVDDHLLIGYGNIGPHFFGAGFFTLDNK